MKSHKITCCLGGQKFLVFPCIMLEKRWDEYNLCTSLNNKKVTQGSMSDGTTPKLAMRRFLLKWSSGLSSEDWWLPPEMGAIRRRVGIRLCTSGFKSENMLTIYLSAWFLLWMIVIIIVVYYFSYCWYYYCCYYYYYLLLLLILFRQDTRSA